MKTVASRDVLKAFGRPNSTLLNNFVLLFESSIGSLKASKSRFKTSIGYDAPWWPHIKTFYKRYLTLFLILYNFAFMLQVDWGTLKLEFTAQIEGVDAR